jgi:hypothetical protein
MLSMVLPDIHGHDMPSVGGHALLHLNGRLLFVFGGKTRSFQAEDVAILALPSCWVGSSS